MAKIRSTALGLTFALLAAVPIAAAQAPVSGKAPAPLDMAAVRQYLVGTWQNDGDPRRTRELDADGRAFDRLVGEESDSEPGAWRVFLGSAAPAQFAGSKLDPKIVYLEVDRDGDTLLYALLQISRSQMHMVYLMQNQEIAYSRLK